MRDKSNKLLLGFKYRASKWNRERVAKNARAHYARNKEAIKARNSLKNMYGDVPGLSCNICKEDRAIEFCHVIPVVDGGDSSVYNLLVLCPTHHTIFDYKKLSDVEYDMIRDKVEIAHNYQQAMRTFKAAEEEKRK